MKVYTHSSQARRSVAAIIPGFRTDEQRERMRCNLLLAEANASRIQDARDSRQLARAVDTSSPLSVFPDTPKAQSPSPLAPPAPDAIPPKVLPCSPLASIARPVPRHTQPPGIPTIAAGVPVRPWRAAPCGSAEADAHIRALDSLEQSFSRLMGNHATPAPMAAPPAAVDSAWALHLPTSMLGLANAISGLSAAITTLATSFRPQTGFNAHATPFEPPVREPSEHMSRRYPYPPRQLKTRGSGNGLAVDPVTQLIREKRALIPVGPVRRFVKDLEVYRHLVFPADRMRFLEQYPQSDRRAHFLYASEGFELISASGRENNCFPSSICLALLGYEDDHLSVFIRAKITELLHTIVSADANISDIDIAMLMGLDVVSVQVRESLAELVKSNNGAMFELPLIKALLLLVPELIINMSSMYPELEHPVRGIKASSHPQPMRFVSPIVRALYPGVDSPTAPIPPGCVGITLHRFEHTHYGAVVSLPPRGSQSSAPAPGSLPLLCKPLITRDTLLERLETNSKSLVGRLWEQTTVLARASYYKQFRDDCVPNEAQSDADRAAGLDAAHGFGYLRVCALSPIRLPMPSIAPRDPSLAMLPRSVAAAVSAASRSGSTTVSSPPIEALRASLAADVTGGLGLVNTAGMAVPLSLTTLPVAPSVGPVLTGLDRPAPEIASATALLTSAVLAGSTPDPEQAQTPATDRNPEAAKPVDACVRCGLSTAPLSRCSNPLCKESFHAACDPASSMQDGTLCHLCRCRSVPVPSGRAKGKKTPSIPPPAVALPPEGAYTVSDGPRLHHSLAIRNGLTFSGDIEGLLAAITDNDGASLQDFLPSASDLAPISARSDLSALINHGFLSTLAKRAGLTVALLTIPGSPELRTLTTLTANTQFYRPLTGSQRPANNTPVIIIGVAWRQPRAAALGANFIVRLDPLGSSQNHGAAPPWASSAEPIRGAPLLRAQQLPRPASQLTQSAGVARPNSAAQQAVSPSSTGQLLGPPRSPLSSAPVAPPNRPIATTIPGSLSPSARRNPPVALSGRPLSPAGQLNQRTPPSASPRLLRSRFSDAVPPPTSPALPVPPRIAHALMPQRNESVVAAARSRLANTGLMTAAPVTQPSVGCEAAVPMAAAPDAASPLGTCASNRNAPPDPAAPALPRSANGGNPGPPVRRK